MSKYSRFTYALGIVFATWLSNACSDLSVFVPPPRFSDIDANLALNEEGDLAVSWGIGEKSKNQKVSVYLLELDSKDETFQFTEAAQTAAPLIFEEVKVERAQSPYKIGEKIESVNDVGMLVRGRLAVGKKYLLQVNEDNKAPKAKVNAYLLQVNFNTEVASSASSTDGSITLSWNAVTGANRYRVYADEAMTVLLGESPINEMIYTPLPGQRFKEFYVQPVRGNLISKSVIHIGLSESDAKIVKVRARSPDGRYTTGDTIEFSVEFSLPINVFGDSSLPLVMDTVKRKADYISGTGTKELLFRYLVQAGDDTERLANDGSLLGDFVDPSDLSVSGRLPSMASAENLLATASISIDTIAPTSPVSVGFNVASTGTGQVTASWQSGSDKYFSTDAIKLCSDTACSQSCDTETLTTSPSKNFTSLNEGLYYACVQSRDSTGLHSAWVSSLLPVAVDKTGPAIAKVYATTPAGYYKENQTITIAVEFNENVLVTGDTDVKLKLETGTVDREATYLSGSGSKILSFSYTVMAGDTTQDLDIYSSAALTLGTLGSLKDALGNDATLTLPAPASALSLAGQSQIVIDTNVPSAPTSVSAGGSYSMTTQVSVSWTDATDTNLKSHNAKLCTVNTCDSGCLTVANNATSPALLTGTNGTQYFACVQGEDLAGNLSVWSPSPTATLIDSTAPSVVSVSASTANGVYDVGQSIDITVQFTEAVTVINSGDLSLALETGTVDHEAAYFSGDGTDTLTFRYTVQAGDGTVDLNYRGTDSLSLGSTGGLQDLAGHPANRTLPAIASAQSLAGQKDIGLDTVAPTNPVGVTFTSTLSNQLSLPFSWTASTDLHLDHYNVKLCQAADCSTCLTATQASQSPSALSGVNGQSYYACVQAEDVLSHTSDWVASTVSASIDTTAPQITDVTSSAADGYFVSGNTIDIQVTFSKAVTVTDGPNLKMQLATLPLAQDAVYQSGSGTAILTFQYQVQAGDSAEDLEYASATALTIGGSGHVRDAAGNDADLTLPATGSSHSLGGQKQLIVDTTAPAAPGAPGFAHSLSATTSFDVSWALGTDTHFDTHNVKLCASADCTTTCSSVTSSATSPLSLSGTDGSSYYACVQSKDLAGLTSAWIPSLGTVTIDSVAPVVTEVNSSTADGAYNLGDAISIQVKFSKNVYVTNSGDIELELDTGATNRKAVYSSGDGTNTLSFTYTVAAGDASSDLNYRSTSALIVGGSGEIKDLAGSDATRTLPALNDSHSLAEQKSIVIDTENPLAPVISTPADASFQAAIVSVISGTSEANAKIRVMEGATEIGNVVASGTTWTLNLSTALGNGSHTLTATAEDAAGNVSVSSAAITFVVDTNGPPPPTIDSLTPTLRSVMPSITGTRQTNATVKLYANGVEIGEDTSTGTTTWSISPSQPIDADYTLTAKSTDPAARVSADSNAVNLSIDTAVPSAPSNVAFSSSLSNSTSIPMTWTASADDHFKYHNLKLCEDSGCSSNCVSATTSVTSPATLLGVDQKIYYGCVQGEDELGHTSAWIASAATVQVDSNETSVLRVTASSADAIYKEAQTVSIDVIFSRIVTVSNGTGMRLVLETGTVDQEAVYTTGSGTDTLTFTYTVQAGDNSNDLNYSSPTALLLNGATIVDSVPAAANITLPPLLNGNSLAGQKAIRIDTAAPGDPGSVGFAGTHSNTLSFPMTWSLATDENLDHYNVKICSSNDCSTSCTSASTSSSLTKSMTGVNGNTYYGCVQAEDAVAHVSSWISSVNPIIVDTTAPTVSTVTSSLADGSYKEGQLVPISVTFSEPVFVTSTSDVSLKLETGATPRFASYSSGSGSATLVFNYTVQAGDSSADLNVFDASALTLTGSGAIKDAANSPATLTVPTSGASSLSGSKAIVIDTTAPAAPVITSPANAVYLTTDLTTLSGTSEANATIIVKNGATEIGTTVASGTSWTLTLGTALTDGIHSLTATATDAAQNVGAASSANVVTVDTTPPLAPVITSSDLLTQNVTPTVAGTSEADMTIKVYASGTLVGTATANSFGNWTLTTSTLADGVYTIKATATDPGSRVSPDSATVTYTIDNTAPTAPTNVVFETAYSASTDLNVSWGASTDAHFKQYNAKLCSYNNCVVGCLAESSSLTTSITLTGVSGSSYYACVQGEDELGKKSAFTASAGISKVDLTPPTVSSVSSSTTDGVYGAGATIDLTVTFSENIAVTNTGDLGLMIETGTTDRRAVYVSHAANTIVFRYTVTSGDNSPDLDYVDTAALILGTAGTITDLAGNAANRTLPNPGDATSIAGSKALIVDTTAPSDPTGVSFPVSTTNSLSSTLSWSASTDANPSRYNTQLCSNAACSTSCIDSANTTGLSQSKTGSAGSTYYGCVQAQDAAGNLSAWVASASLTIDTTAPTVLAVNSTQTDGSYTTSVSIPITVKFSKVVTVTNGAQIGISLALTPSNRRIIYSSGSGSDTLTFNYVVVAGDTSADLGYANTSALTINAGGAIKDASGNDANLTLPAQPGAGSLSTNRNIVVDTTAPNAPVITSPANGAYVMTNVTSVSGTSEANASITIKNGSTSVGTATADASGNWTSTLSTTLTDGVHSLTATATDAATNVSGASSANSVTVDTTAPATPVITSSGATTNDNTPDVSGTAEANTTVKVYAGSTEVASVTSNGAGVWTATLSSLSDGTYSVTAKAVDPGLRASSASNAISFTIDTVAPTVSDVSASTADGTYPKDSVINPTVTFSEVVTYTVSPTLTLETGTSDAIAAYSSGNGTNTITFAFTVASGHTSSDLDYVATTSLTGTLRDAAGNNAVLTLPTPGATHSLKANKAIVIDGVVPTISSVSSDLANGVYPATTQIDIKVNFSKNVTVTGTPTLALNTSPAKSASYVSGSGSSTLVFRYTVASGDTSSDLEYTSTSALALAGGTIKDSSGNNATLTLPATATANSLGGSKNIEVAGSTQAPTLSANPSSTNAFVDTAITPINVSNSTGNDLTNDGRAITYSCLYDETINGTMDAGGTDCGSLPGTKTFNTSTGVLTWTPSTANQSAYNSAKSYEFKVTGTSPANLSGSVIFTAKVIRGWTSTIGFDAGTAASYTFDNTLINHTGGKVSLLAKDQLDDQAETDWGATGNGAAKANGTYSALRNGISGFCGGHLLNCFGSANGDFFPQNSNKVVAAHFNGTINENLSHPSPGASDCPVISTTEQKTWWNGAYFDRGDYLTTPRGVIKDDFTVNVWIKTTQNDIWGSCAGFWEGWGIVSAEQSGQTKDWGVSICDGYILGGVGGASADVTVRSTSRVNDNVWHMVTFTRQKSSGQFKLYIDGLLQVTGTNDTSSLDAAANIYIGRNPPDGSGFLGYMDDMILWKSVLSETEIQAIYDRQAPKNVGQWDSRVIDAGYTNAPWTSMTVATNVPAGKELPDGGSSETTTDYPTIPSNLMSGIKGLYHLNETSGSYPDRSGSNVNSGVISSVPHPGRFGKAIYLNGTTDHVNFGQPTSSNFGSGSFSSSVWIRTSTVNGSGVSRRIFSNGFYGVNSGWTVRVREKYANFGIGCTGTAANCVSISGSTVIADNRWHHIVTVTDRTAGRVRLYVDGVQETPTQISEGTCGTITGKDINISGCSALNADRSSNYTYIGVHGNYAEYYEGLVDEFAFWNRALSAAEALQLYKRGATRSMIQVRACANAGCSDNPAWKGPDGTNQTYFSELNNNSSPSNMSGTVNVGRLTLNFADYGLTLTGRYFQYRVLLESDDINNLCNYGSAESCSPEIIKVSVAPDHYPIAPTISYNTAIPFYTFNSLSETLGGAGCSTGVRYQLSINGSSWYYHNGTTWVAADTTYAKANTLAQMNTYGLDFANMVGRTNLYIRALLGSSGTTACELDSLTLGGNTTY